MSTSVTLSNFIMGKVSMRRYINFVERELLKQGCRAMRARTDGTHQGELACAYRGKDGTACGIGQTISDSVYDPSWDVGGGKTVATLIEHYRGKLGVKDTDNMTTEKFRFLCAVQSVHDVADDMNFPSSLKLGMNMVRETFKLKK